MELTAEQSQETVYSDDNPAPDATEEQLTRRGELVDKKYLHGLTTEEAAELARLDHLLDYQPDNIAFYRPILDRMRREVSGHG